MGDVVSGWWETFGLKGYSEVREGLELVVV